MAVHAPTLTWKHGTSGISSPPYASLCEVGKKQDAAGTRKPAWNPCLQGDIATAINNLYGPGRTRNVLNVEAINY